MNKRIDFVSNPDRTNWVQNYYTRDTRPSLPQPVKRFVVGAWDQVADFAHCAPPDVAVIVLAPDEDKAQDTIRQLRPNFEAFEAREATEQDEDKCLLLNDFRDKYNTR